jgi:hypothetical protein
MIFAGYKLRRHRALQNPTVLIVVDRRDLKTQLSDDFDACDYPNVEKALGVQDLKAKLRAGWRGTLVTTIHSPSRSRTRAVTRRELKSCVGIDATRRGVLVGRRVLYSRSWRLIDRAISGPRRRASE